TVVNAARYISRDQLVSVGLLLVAFLLIVWLLVRLFEFVQRWSLNLKGFVGVVGFGIYILSGFLALGLAANFVWSLFKRDLSPWWFWPAGVVAIVVLMIVAGNLLRLLDKDD